MHRRAPHHGQRASYLSATRRLAPCSSITEHQKLPSPPSLVLLLPALPSRSTPTSGRRAPPWPPRELLFHYRSPSIERPCSSHLHPPQSLHDLLSVPRLRAAVANRALAAVAGCRSLPTAVRGQANPARLWPNCAAPRVCAGPWVLPRSFVDAGDDHGRWSRKPAISSAVN